MSNVSRINWVSNLEMTPSGGGSYAVNFQACQHLSKHFDVTCCEPIATGADRITGLISKVRRKVFQLPGTFPVFSRRRLLRNANLVQERLPANTDLVFFRGITPWSAWRPDRPFVCYCDVALHTFFHNTFDPGDFHRSDLKRIWDQEREFMRRAHAVFFESRWGLEKTAAAYDLEGDNFFAAGVGGNLPIPESDRWDGESLRLLSIAKRFTQKGGDVVREAFLELKSRYPTLRWHIVGGEPDFKWQTADGVFYEGFLNPERPEEQAQLAGLLANAFLLLHPTREDINPLVITEAATFGCPSVSVRRFAIPELVRDGESGLLVDYPANPEDLVDAISSLIEDQVRYRSMREAARRYALDSGSWEAIGNRMAEIINARLA